MQGKWFMVCSVAFLEKLRFDIADLDKRSS